MKKKIALLMACVMAFGVAVGGTLAWLTDSTEGVKNTFTDSDVNITLTESGTTFDETDKIWEQSFKMVPGHTIAKAPLVTVNTGSEDCYVFVKIEKSSSYDTYLENYEVDGTVWSILKDNNNANVDGVYYHKVTGLTAANAVDWSKYVLKAGELHEADCENQACTGCGENRNGYVTVKSGVTKEQMNALKETDAVMPTLSFTAYATQLWKDNDTEFGAYEAWQQTAGYVAP